MAVFDTYAWIEYFEGSKKGENVRELIESNEEIFTPAICLAEMKYKYLKEKRDFKERLKFILGRSVIISVDKEISLLSAELKLRCGLYIIDAMIYATAKTLNQTLVSGDQHFRNLDSVFFLN